MALVDAMNVLVTGTTITVADLNDNFSRLRSGVNTIDTAQISDGAITAAKVSSTSPITLAKISTGDDDALLSDTLENFIDGVFLTRTSDTALSVSAGSVMINGKLRRNTSATSNSPTLTVSNWHDVYVVADADASTFTVEVCTGQANPGAGVPSGTNVRMIGSIYADSDTDLNKTINYRDGYVMGWDYIQGDNTQVMDVAVTFGVTFSGLARVAVTNILQQETNAPEDINDFDFEYDEVIVIASKNPNPANSTAYNFRIRAEQGETLASTSYFGWLWVAYGRYS